MPGQGDGDGLIWLDAKGYVVQTNTKGQEYLALLAQVGVGDALTHLGEHPLPDLMAHPATPGTEICQEVVLEGPPCRIFAISIQSVLAEARFKGWVLAIREVSQEQSEQTSLKVEERPATVIHWPPASPLTSSLP
jgi:hypothetical protein